MPRRGAVAARLRVMVSGRAAGRDGGDGDGRRLCRTVPGRGAATSAGAERLRPLPRAGGRRSAGR